MKNSEILNKAKILHLNPFLLFLPLLFMYIIIVVLFSKDIFQGDEERYVRYANNIIQGLFSPFIPNVNLTNGPGYPIILVPFVALKLPIIYIKLLNAIFLYFSAIFFFKTLLLYNLSKTKIILYSYLVFGLYYVPFQMLSLILTEIFLIFLISVFSYMFCYINQKRDVTLSNIVITSFILAYIALTKVIFGYVILACILFFISFYFIKKSLKIKRAILIYLLALIFCAPYLMYTYSITNKIFYWGNSGGIVLYWMSAPYENVDISIQNSSSDDISNVEILNHKVFFDSISNLPPVERDNVLKNEALKNIKKHPKIYFVNWLANIGRMLFSYPFFYSDQTLKTYYTIIPNMFIVVLSIFLFYPTIKFIKYIPSEIILLSIFAVIYFFGSSLLRAYRRQFYVLIPIIGLWFAYMLHNFIYIKYIIKDKLKDVNINAT